MAGNIFVLLVGINDYAAPVGRLTGCINDIDHMQAYLTDTFDASKLHIEVLKNADATRANVVSAFKRHLGNAHRDDVALFQYSGHGAQSISAQPFRKYFPGGLDEGLVLYDSRPDGGDLADKEIAVLLAELAKNDPSITVILDCCHSGSATRQLDDFSQFRVRQIFNDGEERPLDHYIDGYYQKLLERAELLEIPNSRHILLSACERGQKAWEGHDKQGVFTKTLLDVLSQTGPAISYADLFMRCRQAVRKSADNQTPQFETYRGFSAYSGFLGGTIAKKARRYVVQFDNGWVANCGALHGLTTDVDKPIEFALYDAKDASKLVGHAVATQVGAQKSVLDVHDAKPLETDTFQAELTSLPVPPLIVQLVGDADATRELQAKWAKADNQLFGFVLATENVHSAKYTLGIEKQRLMLRLRESQKLIQGAGDSSDDAVAHIFDILKKIADWERSQALRNPSTKLNPAEVEFGMWEESEDSSGKLLTNDELIFAVTTVDGQPGAILGTFKGKNSTKQLLHFALFYYSDDYGIKAFYNQPIEPESPEFVITMDGDSFCKLELDDDRDVENFKFKLIVSTEKIDDFLLTQDAIKIGGIFERTRSMMPKGLTTGDKDKNKLPLRNEWFTKDIRVQLVRQNEKVGTQDVQLANGKIKIKGTSTLEAGVSLNSARTGARSLDPVDSFYVALERQGMGLINFSSTRGSDQSILELTNIRNADSLAENPLEIELDFDLNENEQVLPLTFDGEHILLAGDPSRDDGGLTTIRISQLPEQPQNTRSLGRALRLYFFKSYLHIENLNQLCWIEYQGNGEFKRHADSVAERVKKASNVALLIHGIIGNTDSIVQGLRLASDSAGKSVDSRFDLVLTYDYENLSTPIEDTARQLKQQLQSVGLQADDGKSLTLFVHSMGGLVSRWFIEREAGNKVVDHLVMFGTPNVGSPFGKVDSARKLSSILTTLALNTFPAIAPFGGVLLYVLNRSTRVTPCLEQMNSTSEFIKKLNQSPDPGVRYTIYAGDIHAYDSAQDTQLGKLVAKLGAGGIFKLLYPNMGHDIAVSDESIRGVPDSRTPSPRKYELRCHHLNYFSTDDGLNAMAQAAGLEVANQASMNFSPINHAGTANESPTIEKLSEANSSSLPFGSHNVDAHSAEVVSDPPVPPAKKTLDSSNSLQDRLLEFILDFVRRDKFAGCLAVFAVTWTWLTLVGLTISLTREIRPVMGDVVGMASILAAVPTAIAWWRLAEVTRATLTMLESAILQVISLNSAQSGQPLVGRLAVPVSKILQAAKSWSTNFIAAWILIVLGKAITGVVVTTYALFFRF